MSEMGQVREDLHFVRGMVERKDRRPPPGTAAIYYVWSVYTLIGYSLIDVMPEWSGRFLSVGGLVAGALSAWIGHRAARLSGEWDPAARLRMLLHWAVGPLLAVVATFGLCYAIPPLRQHTYPGQIVVCMIGMVYFLGGIHFDRLFLGLGPILIAGGIGVGLVPHFGWTVLGIVIACGLTVPTFFPSRRRAA